MNTAITKQQSNTLYILRAIAILFVVFAHTGTVESSDYPISYFCYNQIGNLFIPCGVCIFMILSGFFFYYDNNSATRFFVKKLRSLVFPWMVTGIFTYLYVALRKGGDFLSGIKFIFGIGSYLWYMTVLFVLYCVFYFGRKSKWFLRLVPIVSIISYCVNPFIVKYIYSWGGAHLNVFNWALFFWVGFSIAEHDLLTKLLSHLKKIWFVYFLIWGLMMMLKIRFNIDLSYWSIAYVPYTLIGTMVLLWIASLLSENETLIGLGRDSFSIYLIHLPVAGIINMLFHKVIHIWILVFVCPIITVVICESFLSIYKKLVNLPPKKISRVLKMCIGLR